MEEGKNEITHKEYNDFVEAISAVKEYLSTNVYSSLSSILLRRLEETSVPVFQKIIQNLPKRTRRNRLNSDNKEFYDN